MYVAAKRERKRVEREHTKMLLDMNSAYGLATAYFRSGVVLRRINLFSLAIDFVFDAGSHQGMYRRLEGYRVNVDEQLVMKITIEMGEDAGTYVAAKVIYPKLEKAAKREFGKRWQKAAGVDFDYAAAFSQMRNLVSQLSNSCVFKVDENGVGFTLTIMPLTKGLVDFAKGQEAAAGTFVKIQLRNAA
jgi:hypothetical protein